MQASAAADRAVDLLSASKWEEGVRELRRCHSILEEEGVSRSEPSFERHRLQCAVWDFLWENYGNKKFSKM